MMDRMETFHAAKRAHGEAMMRLIPAGHYVAEFEFRYNNREANGCDDGERSRQALRGLTGKRLTYGGPHA